MCSSAAGSRTRRRGAGNLRLVLVADRRDNRYVAAGVRDAEVHLLRPVGVLTRPVGAVVHRAVSRRLPGAVLERVVVERLHLVEGVTARPRYDRAGDVVLIAGEAALHVRALVHREVGREVRWQVLAYGHLSVVPCSSSSNRCRRRRRSARTIAMTLAAIRNRFMHVSWLISRRSGCGCARCRRYGGRFTAGRSANIGALLRGESKQLPITCQRVHRPTSGGPHGNSCEPRRRENGAVTPPFYVRLTVASTAARCRPSLRT